MVRPLPPSSPKWTAYRIAKTVAAVALFSGGGFLGYRIFVSTPRYRGPEADLTGKTVLVTEPNARVSRELLQGLARRGANLILPSASMDDCESTRDKLLRLTRINSNRIDCRRLDLDSTTSIRRFAAGILTDYPKLHAAVVQSSSSVTGIVAGKRRPTHDGFEHQLGTNYFANYLLCRLLWDRLNESNGRLVLVVDTDAAHKANESAARLPDSNQVALPIDDLNFDRIEDYQPKLAFQRSQWFLAMFADELARRTAGEQGASVLVANPIVSRHTGARVNQPDEITLASVYHWLNDVGARLLRRRAAATALFCTLADPAVLELTGTMRQPAALRAPLYQDMRLIASSVDHQELSEDTRSAAELLWAVSEKWTRLDTNATPLPLPVRPSTKTTPVTSEPDVTTAPVYS